MPKRKYSELIQIASFNDRLRYLMLYGRVGEDTFGVDRYLNQDFYVSKEWRDFRDFIVTRDRGCDLAHPEFPISDWDIGNGRKIRPKIFIHHLNPLTKEDILQHSDNLFDPENVVCVTFKTHNIIHYGHEGSKKGLLPDFSDRTPFDTCPWRKGVL